MKLVEQDEKSGLPIFIQEVRKFKPFNRVIVTAREAFAKKKKTTGSYKDQLDYGTLRLCYVYFMEHPTSPFVKKYPNEEDRIIPVMDKFGITEVEGKKECDELKEARLFYRELLDLDSLTISVITSARKAAHRSIEYYDSLFQEGTDGKKRSVNPATFIKQLKEIKEAATSLADLERNLEKEIDSSFRIKGGREIEPFENPTSDQLATTW